MMKQRDLLLVTTSALLLTLFAMTFISCANSNDVYWVPVSSTGGSSGGGDGASQDNPLSPPPGGTRVRMKRVEKKSKKSEETSSSPAAQSSVTGENSGGNSAGYSSGYSDVHDSPLDNFDDFNADEISSGDYEGRKAAASSSTIIENSFRAVESSPLSTFSIDVDAASYSNVRGYLKRGQLPPRQNVRIEEMINYFTYDYEEPTDGHPFSFATEVSDCPWDNGHKLVRVALQGHEIHPEQSSPSNIVFLIDVSGSMNSSNKLPLLKDSFYKLVDVLRPEDRVAIVVYAGAAGLVLESTPGSEKRKIKTAIDHLKSGGSTAGGAGINLAYKVAKENFLEDGNNRVILATDGDFNVGVSSQNGLVTLIEEKRKEGVFLSVLGFGTGNYQDAKMEQLADNGNGNYYYIDRLDEGERILASELSGTLYAIAKDVKLQIEFNPAKVKAFRLIGYENRVLTAREFDDDTKDAGELGAGHSVTAFYEIVPVGEDVGYDIDTSQGEDYRLPEGRPDLFTANDLMVARLRYKHPKDSTSNLIEHLVRDERKSIEKASADFRFAAAVSEWGLLLRGSTYAGSSSYDQVEELASGSLGKDPDGYRKEFVELVKKAKELDARISRR